MIAFQIAFIYHDIEYKAYVHRIGAVQNATTQYHIHDVTPKVENLPNPWMFISNPEKKEFTFSNCLQHNDMAIPIINAIYNECMNNNIPIH